MLSNSSISEVTISETVQDSISVEFLFNTETSVYVCNSLSETAIQAIWDRDLTLHTIDNSAGKLTKETNAIESGNWQILNNQMIFSDASNTELFRVNLFDKTGSPSEDEVYRRIRV